MTKKQPVDRDERTVALENASYSIGYKVIAYLLLFDVAYRAFMLGESSWDLLILVILSGFVITGYQAREHILSRTWVKLTIFAVIIAAAIAVIVAFAIIR